MNRTDGVSDLNRQLAILKQRKKQATLDGQLLINR